MGSEAPKLESNQLKVRFPFDSETYESLNSAPSFGKIYISSEETITVKPAAEFRHFPKVDFLQLWCGVTRSSVREVLRCPGLKSLVIFQLEPGGRLHGFDEVQDLECLSSTFGLNSNDFREIAKLPSLRKLGAQHSNITVDGLMALLNADRLVDLDLECSNFNDQHAEVLSGSSKVTTLEVGATRITQRGLAAICRMEQLKELDIWANNIDEGDLETLTSLRNLEYLSLGGHDDQTDFTPDGTFFILERLPSLKRVWLDGFRVTRAEWEYLNRRYEQVKVTSVDA